MNYEYLFWIDLKNAYLTFFSFIKEKKIVFSKFF